MSKVRLKSRAHIDKDKERLEKDAARIIDRGTLADFQRMLKAAGIDPESARGRELVDRFISLGGGAQTPL